MSARLSANWAASRCMLLRVSPEDGACASAPRVHPSLSLTRLSSTTSSCWWAALASIPAAPILLWRTPSGHPIGEACVAIVGSRSGGCGRSATGALSWAALSMHPAAPLFLAHRPSHNPIGEAVGTVVWVGRRSWDDGRRQWHWHWRGDWLGASNVVNPAAPTPLICLPDVRCVHCAVEGVDWTDRPRRRCRARRRPWRCWWGCGRWGWRWSRRRGGLRNNWLLGGGGATDSACTAAIRLLRWRPHGCHCRVDPAK